MILGSPLGTYILRTKGTRNNTGNHTPIGESRDKGKIPQRNTVNEEFCKQRDWENLKKNFEKQFSYEDSDFFGENTQYNTDQEVKKPISQEEFEELRRKFEKRLKQFQPLETIQELAHHQIPTHLEMETIHSTRPTWRHHNGEQRFIYRPIKVRLILILTCRNLSMFVLPTRKTQMQ